MCGILGGSNRNWNYKNALHAILHRGPDGSRIVKNPEFIMGFVRLSIIDLSEDAMQPMVAEENGVQLVFNGEIYNYRSLREKLKKHYRFRTSSDTEVVLAAYLHYGNQFVRHLEGIFSIGILDRRCKRVKLFRDRVGVKPLYYYYDGHEFAFCSELKGLLALNCCASLQIDYTAVYDSLTYSYIPEPKSMYRSFYKLEPGSYVEYDIASCKMSSAKKYWHLMVNCMQTGTKSLDEAAYELKKIIHKSVEEQLNADVPVGAFLSGGIDSSVVVDEIKRIDPAIRAFSVGFQDERYSELKYARMVAQHLGIELKEEVCHKAAIMARYDMIGEWFDEPFADTSCYPTFMVSNLAAQHVKVVLTGDGGDELFGGYPHYSSMVSCLRYPYMRKAVQHFRCLNEKLGNPYLQDLFLDDMELYSKYSGLVGLRKEKVQFARKWKIPRDYDDFWYIRQFYHKDLPVRTRLQFMDFHSFLRRVLTKVDRVSMQNSIEARVPFLSTEVIEYAFSLPENIRYWNDQLKGILKYAYKDELPKRCLYRQKQGFTLPPQYMKQRTERDPQELLRTVWKI